MDLTQDVSKNKLLGKSFFLMFLGLLGSGIISWYTYSSGLYLNFIEDGTFTFLLIGELIVVLLFSFLFRKLPASIVGVLFFIYSMLTGVTLSSIFYIFELSSIINLFIASGFVFAILGFIGYTTKTDLSNFRIYLTLFLITGLILSFVNILIFQNSVLNVFIDWFILLTFFGVTIYDLNKIKMLSEDSSLDNEKLHIYFAMQIYLDFINIFLRILSIFGKRK